jgi:choline kinase
LRNWYLSVVNELAQKIAVRTVSIEGLWWSEIDSPEDLAAVRGHFLQHHIGSGDAAKGS